MKVNEIFESIEGEGIRAGELSVFIRLAGCNLRCLYCDTAYALTNSDGLEMSIDDILNTVSSFGTKNITLTGGEPLVHKNVKQLVQKLVKEGYKVNIETNGSIDISDYLIDNVLITIDYKTLASGENKAMLSDNFNKLRDTDVLKIVCNKNDFKDIENFLHTVKSNPYIYLSPIYGTVNPSELVDFLKHLKSVTNTEKIRIQLQMHKYIWDPSIRGV